MHAMTDIVSQAITGSETSPADDSAHSRAYAALVAFYRAFNGRDLGLMAANWSQGAEASMSNPLGGLRRGWQDIQEVYRRIFTGPAEVYVEFYDYSLHTGDDMFCAVGRERGQLRVAGKTVDLAIRTSRIYRREADGWRQLHHHGSIESPALLQKYQDTVLGR